MRTESLAKSIKMLKGIKVVISSPYFVPGADGVQTFADLRQRGVEVIILTNSLAANDEPVVHIGYARYRVGLVRAGVELYELSPGGLQRDTWDVFPVCRTAACMPRRLSSTGAWSTSDR